MIDYMRYVVYLFGGYNGSPDLHSALDYAKGVVKAHYLENGYSGECFAVVYDKLNYFRWFVWLDEGFKVRCKRVN